MAVSVERQRALRLLAGSPLGVTEAIMLAHGFTERDARWHGARRAGDGAGNAGRAAADQGCLADDHLHREAGADRMMAVGAAKLPRREQPNGPATVKVIVGANHRECDGGESCGGNRDTWILVMLNSIEH
jgi:hypothetical protein